MLGTSTRNHEPPRPGDCEYSLELESSQQRLQRLAGSDPNVHRAAKAAQPECGWKRGGADSRKVAGQRQCPY